MIEIRWHDRALNEEWNRIVSQSKAPFFQFNRDYMDYHADRYTDASIVIKMDNKIVALLPGNIHEGVYHSHQGLTFGGLISIPNVVRATDVVQLFDEIVRHLAVGGVKKLVYKSLPSIYHSIPSQEDVYVLGRMGAVLEKVELTTTIDNSAPRVVASRRRRGAKKAINAGISFEESLHWQSFWGILVERLKERHGVLPVHSVEEITLLAERFPDNIKLFLASREQETFAGVVIYETPQVAHCQYISASPEGLKSGALDGLFEYLIEFYSNKKRYFDFGISTEDGGRVLNDGLVRQKEEFGGGGIVHATYSLIL